MQFIYKQDDLPVGVGNFLHHCLETIFELATELSTGQQRTHIQGVNCLAGQPRRDVAIYDPLGQAFDDCGFTHAW